MAAVTVTKYRTNIDGALREAYYTLNIANSGDTLTITSMKTVLEVGCNNTAVSLLAPVGNIVTFTSSGAVTGLLVNAVGR